MKKLILLFISILLIAGCDVHGDNDPLDLRVVWDPNPPDQGVTRYEVYWWQGDDTTSWNISYMSMIDTVSHADEDSLVSPPFTVTFNFLKSGVKAVNDNGVSDMGLTRFYSYFEFEEPSIPENIRVIR